MKPLNLKLRGIGPFKNLELDFSSIKGDAIAITGNNGEGKTFLLESIFAALYRYFPSRPKNIYHYCQGRDAQIDFTFQANESIYQSIINLDTSSNAMEPFLIKDGTPITNGKTRPFDAEIAKLLGWGDLALSSVFSSQKRAGSFLELDKADRKSLFIHMLGLDSLAKISDLASKQESILNLECQKLLGELVALRGIAGDDWAQKVDYEKDLEYIKSKIQETENINSEEERLLSENQKNLLSIREKLSLRSSLLETKRSLLSQKESVELSIKTTTNKIIANEQMAQDLPRLRSVLEKIESDENKLISVRSELARAQSELSEKIREKSEYLERKNVLAQEKRTIETDLGTCKRELQRAIEDTSTIKCVPCKAKDEFAKCQFLVRAVEAEESIPGFEGRIDGDKARLLLADQHINNLGKFDDSYISVLETKIKQLKSIADGVAQVSKSAAIASISKAEVAEDSVESLKEALKNLNLDLENLVYQIGILDHDLDHYKEWEEKELSVNKTISTQSSLISIGKDKLTKLNMDLAQREVTFQNAKKARARLEVIQESINKLEYEKGSYEMLYKAFGKTGIQSLELDACGPSISAIANDILFSCFDARFSMKFITQRLTAKKDAYTDDFDIYVYDQVLGREGSIDDLSVGQAVISSEAVGLAISLFNRQRSDIGWQTLFRDEITGPLDKDNASRYLSMLKSARSLGHFSQVFFISHQNLLSESADVRIHISNGKAEITC